MKTEIPTEYTNEQLSNVRRLYSKIDLEDVDRSHVFSLIGNSAPFRIGVRKFLLEYYDEKLE